MPNYEAWKQATGRDKMRIAIENVRDNPHIAAYHFHERFNQFMTHVLIPKFGVVDYWNRYEWQGRGSLHSHGVVWFKTEGRDIPICNMTFAENKEYFVRFWGIQVEA